MPKTATPPAQDVARVCAELQTLQRHRAVVLKSRNMQTNRLQAVVAGTLGYRSGLGEAERKRKFSEAAALIKKVAAGREDSPFAAIIRTTLVGIDAFDALKDGLEKQMLRYAKRLPAAAWVGRQEQRGFGLLFLAIVVGEAGDLSNYANPAKLWRRLGCAPHSFNGKTLMGSTWRAGKEGKLPAEEWESFGYSPRRRSIAYLIGEGLVKQNGTIGGEGASETESPVAADLDAAEGEGEGDNEPVTETRGASPRPCGPYRARYDAAKARAAEAHPDWPKQRCHRHAMLLATKLLLKNLWVFWNGSPPDRQLWRGAVSASDVV